MTEVSGPDFITLLVADLDASLRFYKDKIGLKASGEKLPHAHSFDTKPCGLAIRQSSEKVAIPGQGVLIWLRTTDSAALCKTLKERAVPIVKDLQDGPFGKTFSFQDPDGHVLSVHDGG
jgi:catechol 2,3-dioxygenase-like lactoylglutathione lyase family enzyme